MFNYVQETVSAAKLSFEGPIKKMHPWNVESEKLDAVKGSVGIYVNDALFCCWIIVAVNGNMALEQQV